MFFPTTFLPSEIPLSVLNNTFYDGFYDNKTSEILVDFALYNSIVNMITYVSFDFYSSPTNRIYDKKAIFQTFKATPYREGNAPLLIIFTIVFIAMFLYYFFQEFIKVYNVIKRAAGPSSKN